MKNIVSLIVLASVVLSVSSASANQVINLPPVVITAAPKAATVEHGTHCVVRPLEQGTGTVKACYSY